MPLVTFEEKSPHIAHITLNDPDSLNAMSEDMAAEFSALIKRLKGSADRLRAIILTGAGRAFSAGGDLGMLKAKAALPKAENERRMLEFYNSFLSILELEVPLIAAINGHAIGAGLCLACACDIRVAAKGAKLGFTFVKLGLHPGMGATYFLPRVLGVARATELLTTGRVITADEGLGYGLVSTVTADGPAAVADAGRIAAEIASNGPQSIRHLIASLRADEGALAQMLQKEAQAQAESYAGAEFMEGVTATMEKRKPIFPQG